MPEYGAGELLNPARTFYVSTKGNDGNDGKSLATAWKSIKKGMAQLRAGDTLFIDEGTYFDYEAQINVKDGSVGYAEQCGKPGAPIRIAGMPGKKVVFCGAQYIPNQGKPVSGRVYAFKLAKKPYQNMIMENPSQIHLQRVYSKEIAMEYPGTYYLDDANNLLVHYAAEDQDGINVSAYRLGLRIHGSWILVENLTFTHYYEGIYIRMNKPYEQNAAEHITVRNCNFFHNFKNGLTNDGASFSLFTNNRGMQNGTYGSLMMTPLSHDNLYTGNWFGPSPHTIRNSKEYVHNFALNQYGFSDKCVRNYVIGNVLEDKLSFRWKSQALNARFEDNMCYGEYHVESPVYPIEIRRNWFGGRLSHLGLGGDLWTDSFKGTAIVFKDNVRDKKDFNPQNRNAFEAEKLRMVLPTARFPEVKFTDVRIKFIEHDSAAILWATPECDGWGSVTYRMKDSNSKAQVKLACKMQGTRHEIQLSALNPDTEYEYKLGFNGRRGQSSETDWHSFRTAKAAREPMTLEVGPGKLTLNEAALAVMPGDTVLVLPGTHTGQFMPARSGLPGKPITIKGMPGAVIDGLSFYAPFIDVSGKKHYVIDGLTFANPESESRSNLIVFNKAADVTIKNCRAEYDWMAGGFAMGTACDGIRIVNNISKGGDYPITLSGKNLYVANNTIVDATMMSLLVWGFEDISIKDNIFYRPCIYNKRNTAMMFNDNGRIVSDGNVFWSPIKEHPVGGTLRNRAGKVLKKSNTLKEWQEISGNDMHSLDADPMFVDYEKGDFRLKEGSPAKGKGAALP